MRKWWRKNMVELIGTREKVTQQGRRGSEKSEVFGGKRKEETVVREKRKY